MTFFCFAKVCGKDWWLAFNGKGRGSPVSKYAWSAWLWPCWEWLLLFVCVCVRCAGGGVANAQWLVLSGPMGGPAPLSPLSRPMFPLCVSTSTTPTQAAHTSHRSRPLPSLLPSASTPHPICKCLRTNKHWTQASTQHISIAKTHK